MSKDNALFWILLVIVGLLLADKMGWLPRMGEVQVIVVTAVPAPQLVPVDTAVPVEDLAGAPATAVPGDTVIIAAPATWTAVPAPVATAVPSLRPNCLPRQRCGP